MLTRVTNSTFNASGSSLTIYDIASSGEQIFLLGDLYSPYLTTIWFWSFTFNKFDMTPENIIRFGPFSFSNKIAVYQNGITTTVVLAQYIQIREIVVQSDTGTLISNKVFSKNFNF